MEGIDLIVGHVYRAKKPARSGMFWDDRMILHIGPTTVQYDSPTIRNGRHYPSIDIQKFLKWVGRDVTDITPEGDWNLCM